MTAEMEIFISWSGTRSRQVALALDTWIHDVIHTATPWVSDNIPAGAIWQSQIALHIQKANFGIICVTATNQHSKWLLFEAGALTNAIRDSTVYVCPYLIDLDCGDLDDGPLCQFQAKRADENGTWQLIKSISDAMKNSPLSEAQLRRSFERCWPDLKKTLDALVSDEPVQNTRLGMEGIIELLTQRLQQVEDNVINNLNQQQLANKKYYPRDLELTVSIGAVDTGITTLAVPYRFHQFATPTQYMRIPHAELQMLRSVTLQKK